MHRNRIHLAVLLVPMLFLAAALADNGRGRHKKMYVVPVPGKVVIDGALNDWDLSGQILMYVVSETVEMQSARFALMYDKDALYISGDVRDPSPMMNRHDPRVDPDRGWDADACQFRMIVDPRQGYPVEQATFHPVDNDAMIHMTLWYYTDRKEPVLQLFKSMKYQPVDTNWKTPGVAPPTAFQAAYRKADDGMGYTFEYRIPWKTLKAAHPPTGGDLVSGTVQFDWSRPDGLKTAGGAAWAYDVMSKPGFAFQSSASWGKIIFSKTGHLPRDLVEEGIPPSKPLPLKFTYSVPEDSDVTVQLFDDTGTMVRTLAAEAPRRAGRNIERWDGLNEDGKPLAAGAYRWRGLYHKPIKTRFILSVHNSGQPPYKLDNNTGGWGGDHGCPTTVCAAGDSMLLAWSMSESGWGIIKTTLKGKKLWGAKHNARDLATDGKRLFVAGDNGHVGAASVKVFDLKDCRPLNWGNGKPALAPPAGGDAKSNQAQAVAYANGRIYVSWPARNAITVYDAKGELLAAWTVPAPGRLAPRPDGSLAVISDGRLVVVRDGKVAPLAGDHLDAPVGIAVAPDGTLYVANRGALQNVSVFSPDGKYLRSIGKAGGRPRVGRYDPSGILEPGGIALDQSGRLWVAETLDAPKRHSVWDTKTGRNVDEFFGGSSYFGWACMDPRHPDEVYCHNVLWKVDLDKRTKKCYSTIWRATAPNMIRQANPGGYAGHFRVMTARNGKQFGWGMIDYSNMLFMREGDVFKPIAGTIRVAFGQYGGGFLYPAMKGIYERTKAGAFMWQDANDDQTVQESELTVSPAGRGEQAFNWIDSDLNAWCDAGYIYRPVRFEKDGRPVYDWSQRDPIPWRGGNANATSLWLDNRDDTVYTLSPGRKIGFAHWTRDHKLLWAYDNIVVWNRALNLPVVTPGKLWGLTMPLGCAGDFTGAACYFGPYHIFTRDGLYVAMVMRDGRTGGLGADITASEVVTGQLVKPDGMDRYFLLAGDQDGRITEILGLDTVKRLDGGVYTHTAADVATVAKAKAEYEALLARAGHLDIVRGLNTLADAKAVGKTVDDKRAFSVKMAYDAKNLYVAYDVSSPYPLVNEWADPHTIFKGGNLLDVQIATDPAADAKRKTPAPGDVRILVTRQKGKPVAVVFRPKLKGFRGEPIILRSPTGTESFDAIDVTNQIGLQYKKKTGGFSALVTIPLSLLDWTPKPGQSVRLDVGYLFGNVQGSQVALRAYWANNGFSAGVTNDIPNESRLVPAEWGAAVVE